MACTASVAFEDADGRELAQPLTQRVLAMINLLAHSVHSRPESALDGCLIRPSVPLRIDMSRTTARQPACRKRHESEHDSRAPERRGSRGTEGDANADLPASAIHGIGCHTVEPDASEQERRSASAPKNPESIATRSCAHLVREESERQR